MGLFGSKKHKGKDENETPEVVQETKSKKRKKKKDGMASVFQETVVEATLDDFSLNEQFIINDTNGEVCYIGLLFDTTTIGGFSKKSKDEAKGSIVEAINSNRIKAMITPELMDKESMILIPDEMSLEVMDEFALLTDLTYPVVYVYPDGRIEDTDLTLTYEQMCVISTRAQTAYEVLHLDDDPNADADEAEDDTDASYDEEMSDDVYIEDEATEMDDEAAYGDDDFNPDEYDNEDASIDDVPTDYESEDYEGPESEMEGVPEDEEAEPEEEPLDEVPADDVWATIQRKFYSDDLGLEVSTEPFDAQFLHGNPYIEFNENRGDGWLNNQLNQMSHNANIEMSRMHTENINNARRVFFNLLSKYCDNITQELDSSKENTHFGAILKQLKLQKAAQMDELDELVSRKRDALKDKWEKTLDQVGEDAKVAAQSQYRERHGRQHEQDMMNVEFDMRDEIEHQYNESVKKLNDDRRREASKRLDFGINTALGLVLQSYQKALDKEHARYDDIRVAMEKFIDDNRKNDIAYAETMAEQQKQTQAADKVRAEMTTKIETLTSEYESNKLRLSSEIESLRRESDERLRAKDADCESKINDVKAQNDALQAKLDDMIQKYADLDAQKNAEYKSRITELTNECQAMTDKCDHIEKSYRRANHAYIGVAIVALVAVASVGFIMGTKNHLNAEKLQEQSAIIEQYNQEKAKIDAENEKNAQNELNSETSYDNSASSNMQTNQYDVNAGVSNDVMGDTTGQNGIVTNDPVVVPQQ